MPSSKLHRRFIEAHRIFRGHARIFRWNVQEGNFKLILIFWKKIEKGIFHQKIRGIIEIFVHDHEKFDEASMKRRWSFDDGIFDAMCKWAIKREGFLRK